METERNARVREYLASPAYAAKVERDRVERARQVADRRNKWALTMMHKYGLDRGTRIVRAIVPAARFFDGSTGSGGGR
jgi:hypothetical protein